MASMLMGHGAALEAEAVLVPAGMTLSFLIDEGHTLPFANGVNAVRMSPQTMLQEGFVMSSKHVEGETVHNHELTVLSSDQRAWYAQVDPEDGTCFYAGEHFPSPIRLCTEPGVDGACATGGEHTCDGLLAMDWTDRDLYWVSCRDAGLGVQYGIGQLPDAPEGALVDERNPPSPFILDARAAAKLLREDRNAFEDFWDNQLSSDEDRAPFLYLLPIKMWVRQRQARQWLAEGTSVRDFYAFLHGHEEIERNVYLHGNASNGVPEPTDLQESYERGRRAYFVEEARAFLDGNGETNFRIWAYELDPASRALLQGDDVLAAALAVDDDAGGEAAQSARYGMTVQDIDWALVQATNETVLKDAAEGSRVPYWQRAEGQLLLGADQPETYRKLIELERDPATEPTGGLPNGHITVVSRGGRTSHGKLAVSGNCNRAAVKEWIGAFSRKSISFT